MSLALPPGFPPELTPLATEIHTYFRELPRLLSEGEDRRFVVVRGNELFGVWGTYHDAIRYGHERFPDEKFLAQEIDGRFLDAFGSFFRSNATSGAA